MEELNHLFADFSTLFDQNTSAEEKNRIEASIKAKVGANMDLINKLTEEKATTTKTTTIYL